MSDDLDAARVGGPPADWNKVEVFYNGKWSGDWIEVDAKKGWGIRFAKDDEGQFILEGDHAKRETLRGTFRLRRRDAAE